MASRSTRLRQKGNKIIEQIKKNARKEFANRLREASREVVTQLYDISPAWSGDFRERWFTQLEGRGNRVFVATGVPQIPANLKKGNLAILIGNSSPYATVAMDLEPGVFERQSTTPVKNPVTVGRRVGQLRGQVIAEKGGTAISTADEFWYEKFMDGGGFSAAFRLGSRTGTIKPLI